LSKPGQCAALVEGWHAEWLRSRLGHWGDRIEWGTAREIAQHLDQAITLKTETKLEMGAEPMATPEVISKAAEHARAQGNKSLSLALERFEREGPRAAEHDFQIAGSFIAAAEALDRMLPNETGR
jgi:hypothetical protein